MKVTKFGGSSVANAQQFRKIKKIIDADPQRQIVVTSACGKSSSEDYKVTDLLYLCYAHQRYGVPYDSLWEMLQDKYFQIARDLGLKIDLKARFDRIREELANGASEDYLVSRGEYLTAQCLAEFIDADFVDAADVLAFNYAGKIDLHRTAELLRPRVRPGRRVVIPGFYGALPGGTLKLMSRGGSDVTGSIVANVLDAEVYENWTDVPGIMVADPRIVDNPPRIERLTYLELRELSYMGANVLHDEAIFPIHAKDIPINIRSTNEPENPGTMIVRDCSEEDAINPPHFITGLAGRKDFTAITFFRPHLSTEVGVFAKVLEVFARFDIAVQSIPGGVDTFTVIAPTADYKGRTHEVVAALQDLKFDSIRVDDQLALIAIVGRGMSGRTGISGAFLSELGIAGISIRTISQTADELDIIIGVDNANYEEVIRRIYNKFIRIKRDY